MIHIGRADPATVMSETPTDSQPFSFAVIGEAPFSLQEEPQVAAVLRSIGSSDADFVIDVGDIKSPIEPCSDTLFENRKILFDESVKPLILLPGNNDWVACAGAKAGGYDPVERLSRLRDLFFSDNLSLGQVRMHVTRESDMPQFREYSANVRWQYGKVLFVGLNLPGVNNDFRFGGGRNGEFEDRLIANRVWLQRAFRYAEMHKLRGLVIAIQADPEFNRPLHPPDHRLSHRDGFYEFKIQLRDLASRYHGHVLLLHGGIRAIRGDEPLKDASGRPMSNVTRVSTFGAPYASDWIRVDVDTHRPRVFSIRSMSAAATESANDSPTK